MFNSRIREKSSNLTSIFVQWSWFNHQLHRHFLGENVTDMYIHLVPPVIFHRRIPQLSGTKLPFFPLIFLVPKEVRVQDQILKLKLWDTAWYLRVRILLLFFLLKGRLILVKGKLIEVFNHDAK